MILEEKLKNKVTLDPRTKLIMVLAISFNAVFISNIYFLLGILMISLFSALLLKSELLFLMKRIKGLIWVLLFLVIIQSIFSPSGKSIISLCDFSIITIGGFKKGIEIFLRIFIIIVSASIITSSNYREMVQGLVQWKIPYEIAFMVLLGIRFLPLFTEEIRDVTTAIQLRGIEFKKIPLKKKIKLIMYIFSPVVANTLVKAQKVSIIMEMKAFRAYPNRTSYITLKMKFLDYLIITISLILGIGIMALYYYVG